VSAVELVASVRRGLDETEAEYATIPFPIRLMVRRGFAKRTGHDFKAWRALLEQAANGVIPPGLPAALGALTEHYRGSPERARRGMPGAATDPRFRELEERSLQRAAAAEELRAALGSLPSRAGS
jgi:hypothetical protein